ncbi:DMT family transporter [Tranquillimonas alkanivorans]|uniref:Small multidrug resistance pump n=1 Tax=Tranquillimonas alkanivorans TaxID=441119 RepID=A0A1I5RPS5_9RHOB|nr:SMR family transporter [Tranquillimonas alkanivorans]SFP60554.1 small multidrug resistance pump [Tranquillimonas alkanivorans]
MQTYILLILAVAAETIGTTALQASHQLTRPLPTLVVAVAYAISFYMLSMVLRTLPVGIAYAMWSGLGIVFIAMIGFLVFGQRLDLPAVLGMALILTGIVVINVFSKSTPH